MENNNMTTPNNVNPEESIIMTLAEFSEACYQNYISGFNQATLNLQKISQGMAEQKEDIKRMIREGYIKQRDAAEVAAQNVVPLVGAETASSEQNV